MALVKNMLLAALLAILFSAAAVYSYMDNRPASSQPHASESSSSRYQTFIVLLWPPSDADAMDKDVHRRWHESFLPSTRTDSGEPRLLRFYMGVFNGFAARLTDAELEAVAKKPGFLHAFPEHARYYQVEHLHWHQLGGRRLRCRRREAGRCKDFSRRG